MSKISVTLDAEIEKCGEDSNYREETCLEVTEDYENSDKLQFSIDGKSFFISKKEIKELLIPFKLV